MTNTLRESYQNDKFIKFINDKFSSNQTFVLSLLNNFPHGLAIVSKDREIVVCNKVILSYYNVQDEKGFTAELFKQAEKIQKNGTDSINFFVNAIDTAFNDGFYSTDWVTRGSNNQIVKFEASLINLSSDNNDNYLLLMITNFTENSVYNFNDSFQAIIDTTPFAINLWDTDMNIVHCNEQTLDMFGVSDKKEYINNFYAFSPEIQPNGDNSQERAILHLENTIANGSNCFKWLHLTKNGEDIPCEITLKKVVLADNKEYIVGFIRDLRSEFMNSESNTVDDFYFLNKIPEKILLNRVAHLTKEWFYSLDVRTSEITFYGSNIDLHGRAEGHLFKLSEVLTRGFVHKDDEELFDLLMKNMAKGVYVPYDMRLLQPDGNYRYFRWVYQPVSNKNGENVFVVGRGVDIHDQKLLEESSKRDMLTGCYDRISAESIIEKMIANNNEATNAVFAIDLDNFNYINDNFGHLFGDDVLRDIAKTLQSYFTSNSVIGRVGGDQFIVFVSEINDLSEVDTIAHDIIDRLSLNYNVHNDKLNITTSLGIAVSTPTEKTFSDLHTAAIKALTSAKNAGKNRYVLFDASIKNQEAKHVIKADSVDRIDNMLFDHELISAVFGILYERNGDNVSINSVLRYVCQKYNADKSYVYEAIYSNDRYELLYEYNNILGEPIVSPKSVSAEYLSCLFDKANYLDCFYSENVEDLIEENSIFVDISEQSIKSIIHSYIYKDNKVKFILGLDYLNKTEQSNIDFNSLQYISKILSFTLQSNRYRSEFQEKLNEQEILVKCIKMLQVNDSPDESIRELLSLIAGFFAAERGVLFQKSFDGTSYAVSHNWNVEGSNTKYMGAIPLQISNAMFNYAKEEGVFFSDDLERDFNISMYPFDLSYINNLMFCPIMDMDNNKIIGFLGIENLSVNIEKSWLLKSLSTFVSDFINKNELISRLNQLSYYDSLTGIKNRQSYRLEIEKIDSMDLKSLGVAYIDIKGLGSINDSKGALYGDAVIINVASMISDKFGENVFRVGGDEFVILAVDIDEKDFENDINDLKETFWRAKDFSVTIGYTWNKDISDVNLHADESRNFAGLSDSQKYSSMLSHNLDKEIESGKYVVFLQPQISFKTGKVDGAEALIRRLDAYGKIQPPITFIPFYEKEGIISKIDIFVLETICKKLNELGNTELQISVNCSRNTLMEENIVQKFSDVCNKYNIDKSQVIIEITETISSACDEVLSGIITSFANAGFPISLDDFGSGYSNLSALKLTDFDELKLDMSLTANVHEDFKSKILTKVALNICEELDDLVSVAEGIETQEQFDVLKEMGCDKGQGYFIDKPMPIEDFVQKYLV